MGLRIPGEAIDRVAARELQELDRREHAYRGGRPLPDLAKRTVILVDDGLATGTTMQAALMALRNLRPARIVVAVPVASEDACERIRGLADEVVCMATPEPFHAVGIWYADFTQTTDDEVRELLADAQQNERSSSSWPTQGSSHASH
jgi:predicted phosphoribosyltransferase